MVAELTERKGLAGQIRTTASSSGLRTKKLGTNPDNYSLLAAGLASTKKSTTATMSIEINDTYMLYML
eukprot:3291282-Amphidinium_carterae.1